MGFAPRALTALGVACSMAVSAASAADFGAEMSRAFVRESEVTVHLRTYYLDRRRPAPAAESEAWAGGGWVGYQSGWLADVFRVGATAYTSQRIWGPPETDGTLLLKPGQRSYSVMGQAYAALKLADHVFTGYRQMVDQPEVNAQDNRMTPNTFQGYTAGGKFGPVAYFAGYLERMKQRNTDDFRDMAAVAGAPPGVKEGMWLGALTYTPYEQLALRLSSYHVSNVLTSTYMDAEWRIPLARESEVTVGAQYMFQSSNGDNLLTGRSFHVDSAGVKVSLKHAAATLSVAYVQTGRDQAWRSPYGDYPGYAALIVEDFNRAGEKAWLIGGAYDFGRHGVSGLSAFVNAAFGDHAIDAATRAALPEKTEYDATVDYRFSGAWPAWLKPLWIRLRAARVEDKTAGVTSVTNDYRAIVNYERVFK